MIVLQIGIATHFQVTFVFNKHRITDVVARVVAALTLTLGVMHPKATAAATEIKEKIAFAFAIV